MSKWFYSQSKTLVLLALTIGIVLLTSNVSFSADTYTIPQTAEVTLAWDPNDPAPDGYRIYQRTEEQSYDYSQPCWTGPGNTGTVYNLDWDTTYYFVVRAYAGTLESADSEAVSYVSPLPETTTYSISATAGEHGFISPGGTVVVPRDSDQTFTIIPDTGYHVANVIVDGVAKGAVLSYTFEQVTDSHTIIADFAVDTYQISASAGANGSISPSGTISVDSGASKSYTITPAIGYHVADVLVDGASMGPVNTYTFDPIEADHTIVVNFAVDLFTLTAAANEGGSISPSGQITVNSGASQTYTLTADTGYEIQDLVINGQSRGAHSSYTLEDISTDYTIDARFVLMNQVPTADAGPDQTVDEAKEVTLSGLNSIDLDDGIAAYQWRQIQGAEVVLSSPDQSETTFTAPNVGPSGTALVFELAVTDYSDVTTVDTCIVNVTWVNVPPTADAGGEQTVSEETMIVLDAVNSVDPDDGIVDYRWNQLLGPSVILSGAESSSASFQAPDIGPDGASLTFELTVTDAGGLQDTDTCLVNVAWINTPPLADAGPDQHVGIGDEVILDGSLSTDTDEDMIVSHRWRQTDGVPVELFDATAETPTFEAPDVGDEGAALTFELTVTDSGGMQGKDTCEVVVTGAVSPEDTTAPTLSIENPSGDSITLSTFRINMSGSAWDDQGVEKVIWENNRGGSGVAIGTTQWQVDKIRLRYGTNIITITATDAAGNTTAVSKTVVVRFRWWWWW